MFQYNRAFSPYRNNLDTYFKSIYLFKVVFYESNALIYLHITSHIMCATSVEPLLRGHPDKRPTPLERPLDHVNINLHVLIYTPNKRPPF